MKMLEEELYREGEKLAKTAVSSGMAVEQLRKIYDMVKIRPLIKPVPLQYIHAHTRRQMSRVKGRSAFKMILNILDKYKDDREAIAKILEYALLLYDPYRNKPVLDLIDSVEPMIRKIVTRHGLRLSDIYGRFIGRNLVELRIKIDGYCRDKASLAAEIQRLLQSNREFSDFRIRIWID